MRLFVATTPVDMRGLTIRVGAVQRPYLLVHKQAVSNRQSDLV
jgi:hypothetical protein